MDIERAGENYGSSRGLSRAGQVGQGHQVLGVAIAGVGRFLDLFEPGERLVRVGLAHQDFDAQPEVVKGAAQIMPEPAPLVTSRCWI